MPQPFRTGPAPMDLHRRLLESLWLWYPQLPRTASLVCVRREEFRWSRQVLFRIVAEAKAGGTELLVKCLRLQDPGGRLQGEARPAEGALELEYQALSKLYEHLGGGRLEGIAAVRPLAYLPGLECVVMERMPGRDFLALVLAASRPWSRRAVLQGTLEAACRAGRLLAALHQIPDGPYPRTELFDVERFQRRLLGEVQALSALTPGATVRELLLSAQGAIADRAPRLGETPTVSLLHGDLYPDNLIQMPDGRVYTIDTALDRAGPTEEDIAKFTVGVQTPKQLLLGGRAVVRPGVLQTITRSFLDGYSSQAAFSGPVLLCFRMLALLRRWAEALTVLQRRVPASVARAVQRLRIDPQMSAHLGHLCNEVRKECGP